MYIYICIFLERERERERENIICLPVYLSTYCLFAHLHVLYLCTFLPTYLPTFSLYQLFPCEILGPPTEGPGAARRGATAAAVGPGAARRRAWGALHREGHRRRRGARGRPPRGLGRPHRLGPPPPPPSRGGGEGSFYALNIGALRLEYQISLP